MTAETSIDAVAGTDGETADAKASPPVADPLTIVVDGLETDPADLSWWRRPRKLRRQLVAGLIVVALLSVGLVGGLNFFAGRRLLDEGAKNQLVAVGEARARSIEVGIERVLGQVAGAAADLSVVEAIEGLSEAYDELEAEDLGADEQAALASAYQENVIDPLERAGLGSFTVDEVLPESNAGRYLQLNYTIDGFDDPESRRTVDDPGDGSAYSELHAAVHPTLVELADVLGGDVLLISKPSGEVVYSVDKRIDLGTDLIQGQLADSAIAEGVFEGLAEVPAGDAVLVDQGIYIPAGGTTSFFAIANVRRGSSVVGTLAAEIAVDSLNEFTTAGGQWEAVGLKDGESYVVNEDRLLGSESRLWIEDPDRYLSEVDDPELAELIETFGSPVGLQPADTAPVRAAFKGEVFSGTSSNYLGTESFSYATPIDATGVNWVMVAENSLSDTRKPLWNYARRIGLVLLIIIPIAALIGYVLAARLSRPVPIVVDAAQAVAEGERDPDLPDLGRNEFGDLARRLNHMAGDLGAQEAAREAEYEERRKLLLTVLPPRVVSGDGEVEAKGDTTAVATVVSVGLDVPDDDLQEDKATLLARVRDLIEDAAADRDIERVRSSADRSLFLTGLHVDDDGADAAMDFAMHLASEVAALSETLAPIAAHIGLATGPVATGVLQSGHLTFGAWGEPVRRALAISALSRSDEVLIDHSTMSSTTPGRWTVRPATDVLALDGQPMELMTVVPG